MKRLVYVLGVMLALIVIISSCTSDENVRREEQKTVGNQQNLYLKSQPAPYFDWSLERYLMTKLYEARNSAVSTWSYTQSPFTGKITWECASIGYPVPGGTQLTNPEQSTGQTTVAQAEPNGLFSPATSEGTFVMCLNDDGTVTPAYVEELVKTFSTPMVEKDGKLIKVEGAKPSLKIDPKRPN